ncbi:MAG: type II toxin-antitoxin system VapC family toxin [Candidatus Sericytochromatia bacterium]
MIWYLYGDPRLSEPAKECIEAIFSRGEQVGVSAITLVEFVYLEEKGRITLGTGSRFLALSESEPARFVVIAIDSHLIPALQRVPRDEVPDMPDRLIAACALQLNVPVISRDRKIVTSSIQSIW